MKIVYRGYDKTIVVVITVKHMINMYYRWYVLVSLKSD